MHPNKQYLALLEIKAIIRAWQDLDLTDRASLAAIRVILQAERDSEEDN